MVFGFSTWISFFFYGGRGHQAHTPPQPGGPGPLSLATWSKLVWCGWCYQQLDNCHNSFKVHWCMHATSSSKKYAFNKVDMIEGVMWLCWSLLVPLATYLVQALWSFKLCARINGHESSKRKGWKIVIHIIALHAVWSLQFILYWRYRLVIIYVTFQIQTGDCFSDRESG